MEYLSEAILELRPEAHFSYNNNDYSTVKWDVLEGDAPTLAEIEAAVAIVKTKKQNEASQRASDKAAAQAKLEALGLTTDDLMALGLGGN
jgi:hypothetical protein